MSTKKVLAAQKIIRELRRSKLNKGLLFMINSNSLPSHQCYLEYPNGSIVIAEANTAKNDFKIVAELDGFAIHKLRKKLKLT